MDEDKETFEPPTSAQDFGLLVDLEMMMEMGADDETASADPEPRTPTRVEICDSCARA